MTVIDINSSERPAPPPPFARWISAAASVQFERLRRQAPPVDASVDELRRHYDAINTVRLEAAERRYAVRTSPLCIDGVDVHRVDPTSGDPGDALLICLHGGAFLWGAGAGAALEAVPVAGTMGVPVIAVEYRLAPEHRFPAAVDDVLQVLSHVRATEPSRRIGIYGCSAGAVLTAQVVARLIDSGAPLPDAIAMLHAAGIDLGGDSLSLSAQLNGVPPSGDIQRLHDLPYFEGTDPRNPLVFPGEHVHMLERFPPSLLVTGSRDFAASSMAVMHRRLMAAGRIAEFVLFDGMWHAHHMDVDMPESEEAFGLLARFFARHLR